MAREKGQVDTGQGLVKDGPCLRPMETSRPSGQQEDGASRTAAAAAEQAAPKRRDDDPGERSAGGTQLGEPWCGHARGEHDLRHAAGDGEQAPLRTAPSHSRSVEDELPAPPSPG